MPFPGNKICHTIAFHYNSRCYIELKALRSKWYGSTKVVPKDLKLTPLTCLVWYLDDGQLVKNKSSKSIVLYTRGFESSGVDFLVELLHNLGLKATRWKSLDIYISTFSAEDFLDYIGPCPVKCYSYKWAGYSRIV